MDFEIAGIQYQSSKLNAKQQFHLARRLAPVITGLQSASDESQFFGAIANAIADMSDEQCNYILDTCLSVVTRQQGSTWVRVFNDLSKTVMFDDIDMGGMLKIAQSVIEDNLGNFFGGLAATAVSNSTTAA